MIEGRNFGVVNFGREGSGPVDALESLQIGVGNKKLGVAAALSAPGVVPAACVGQPPLMTVNIKQRANDSGLALRSD